MRPQRQAQPVPRNDRKGILTGRGQAMILDATGCAIEEPGNSWGYASGAP